MAANKALQPAVLALRARPRLSAGVGHQEWAFVRKSTRGSVWIQQSSLPLSVRPERSLAAFLEE
jgi:hypothetical protein